MRDPIDEAGVQRVLEFEKAAGRNPEEMPHLNPGYDVESRDKAGRLVRIIEVKSTKGDWNNAAMSVTQFREASDRGTQFWLYVVERADKADCVVNCIQDPARRATQFIYDDGWRALHEPGPGLPFEEESVRRITDIELPRDEADLDLVD